MFLFSLFMHICLTAHKFILRYFFYRSREAKNVGWQHLGFDGSHFLVTGALALMQMIFLHPLYRTRIFGAF